MGEVETMPPASEEGPVQTRTERGLRWFVLALGLTFLANAVLLLPVWFLLNGPGVNATTSILVPLVSDLFLVAAAVSGFVGFRRLRQGRSEYGTNHEASVGRGTVAFVLGAGSAVALTVSGLILGFVYVPAGAYVTTSGGASPVLVVLGGALRLIHGLAALVLAPLVGLFLLWSIWRLSGFAIRFLAAGAFALGLVAAVWSAISVSALVPSLPASTAFALAALPAASTAFWLAAYVLVILRIRGLRANVASNAAAV